jgi:signal transduction histidine kinase
VSDRTPVRLLRAAGLATAALAAIPSARRFLTAPTADALVWATPLAAFVGGFLYALGEGASLRARRVALGVQGVAAVAFAAGARGMIAPALTCVVAGQAPFLVGRGLSLAIVGAQTLALGAIFAHGRGFVEGLVGGGGYVGLQLFALGAAVLAEREARAREELARANAELYATRELFADATRTAERLRIARDLHDSLGHELTALRIQLEVARNATGEVQREAIERSSGAAQRLLGAVRETVSAMREEAPIDLERVLGRLATAVPKPAITITIDPALRDVDPALAHAIFRFAQEAITNAARHAGADHLVLSVARDGDRVAVSARDDGRGAAPLREGNGLRGLRERIEALGGTFEAGAPGRGLALTALLPLRRGAGA